MTKLKKTTNKYKETKDLRTWGLEKWNMENCGE